MAGNLAPVLRQRFFNANGTPLAGGKLYSYQSGTSTPQATYTDSGLGTPNANPVTLDANGEANVWLDQTLAYKFILQDSSAVVQWTTDGVIGALTNNAVTTASIQDLAVTTAKLADNSVTSAKLASDASVDGNRAVQTNHVRDGAIITQKLGSDAIVDPLNVGIAASVASSALTIALKTAAGADATSATAIKIPFRSSTAATGTPVVRSVTAALSVVVSSGSTLGSSNGNANWVYVYAIDNAGTVELAVSSSRFIDEGSLVTTTAEGGSGGADSANTLYSTTARSNVAVRLLGRIKSTQATAGTWASSPTEIAIWPFERTSARSEVQAYTGNGHGSTNTKIRRFSTSLTTGTAVTYADSATLGGTFTINEDGIFVMSYTDRNDSASAGFGVSLNSTALTTSITGLSATELVQFSQSTAGPTFSNMSAVRLLRAGDVIRAHTDGTPNNTTAGLIRFVIVKVG